MASPALDREAVNQAISRGSDFLKQGMLDEAQKAFRAALLLDGENARVLALLGLTYFKGGQYEQARPIYEELVERAPTDASHRLNLGLVYLKLGESDKAIGSLEASRALDPSQGRAISYLGLAYARAGRYAEAYRSFILAGQKDLASEIEINLTAAERESIQQQLARAQGGVEPRTKPPKDPPKPATVSGPVATVSQIAITPPPAEVAPASQDQSGSVDVQFSKAAIPVAPAGQDASGSVNVELSMPDIQIERLRSNQDSAPPPEAIEQVRRPTPRTPTPAPLRRPTPPAGVPQLPTATPTPPQGSPGVGDWRRIEREKFERQRAEKAAALAKKQAELDREREELERAKQSQTPVETKTPQRDSDPDVGIKEVETSEPNPAPTEIKAPVMTDSLQFVLPQSEAVPAPAEGQSMISRAVEVATPSSAAGTAAGRVGWGSTPPVPLSQLATESLVRPEDGDEAFEVTAGGSLIIRIKDRMLTRLDGIHVSGGELEYEPAMRRSRGKETEEKFDFGGTRVHAVSGNGYLIAVPGDKKFTAVSLDDDIFYLREDLIFAFEASLRWENGNVPGLRGKLPVVQFRGDGSIALKASTQLVRVKLPAQGVLFIDAMRLAGWIGRVIPRAVVPPTDGPMGEVCVECTGEGVVLIDPSPSPVVTADRERRPSLGGRSIQEQQAAAQKSSPPPPPQPAPIELDVVKKADWLADDEEEDGGGGQQNEL